MIEYQERLNKEKKIFGKDPGLNYHIEIEDMSSNVEAVYFWFLDYLRGDFPTGVGFHHLEKIKDLTAATESSLYFGNIEQRKSIQQDRISQYMATIGRMIKDLFQIVRELRIIDERLELYDGSKQREKGVLTSNGKTAEVGLKDMWIGMVEGGTQNPTSIYGMAQKVNFATLPDLFFSVNPKKSTEVGKEVDNMPGKFNETVKNALKRKLLQYLIWKENTEKEIRTRRSFLIKYMKQHYSTIKMYMNWVKPYLKNVKKLQLSQEHSDGMRPELVTGFDTAFTELELMALKVKDTLEEDAKKPGAIFPCILLQIDHITKPMMAFQQENQRSAVHAGKIVIHLKSYALTHDEIKKYKEEIEFEDFELIEDVREAMESLKEDMQKYMEQEDPKLKEKREEKEKKEAEKNKEEEKKNAFDPFKSVTGEVKKMFKPGPSGPNKWQDNKNFGKASSAAEQSTWLTYDIFKKVHLLLSW